MSSARIVSCSNALRNVRVVELGAVEFCCRQVGVGELHTLHAHALQMRVREIGVLEARALRFDAAQPHVGEIRAGQISADKIGMGEIQAAQIELAQMLRNKRFHSKAEAIQEVEVFRLHQSLLQSPTDPHSARWPQPRAGASKSRGFVPLPGPIERCAVGAPGPPRWGKPGLSWSLAALGMNSLLRSSCLARKILGHRKEFTARQERQRPGSVARWFGCP